MTTPTPPAPTLSLTTDAGSYVVGQTLTLTATYTDAQAQPSSLTITVTATDAEGNTVTATDTVTVVEQVSEQMTLTAADDRNDTYTEVSNAVVNGVGMAVFTAVVGPAAAPAA